MPKSAQSSNTKSTQNRERQLVIHFRGLSQLILSLLQVSGLLVKVKSLQRPAIGPRMSYEAIRGVQRVDVRGFFEILLANFLAGAPTETGLAHAHVLITPNARKARGPIIEDDLIKTQENGHMISLIIAISNNPSSWVQLSEESQYDPPEEGKIQEQRSIGADEITLLQRLLLEEFKCFKYLNFWHNFPSDNTALLTGHMEGFDPQCELFSVISKEKYGLGKTYNEWIESPM